MATLVSSLGGDSNVPAFYDVRYGVTATTTLSGWADARGAAGFGPSFSTTAGTAPAWDSTNLLISGNNDGLIATASSSTFDLTSIKALIFVGDLESVGSDNKYACGIADAASATRILCLRAPGSTLDAFAGGTPVVVSSGVAAGTTRRVMIATLSGTAVTAQVPNHGLASSTAGAGVTSGNNPLTLGTYHPAAASIEYGKYACRALLTMTHVPSAGEVTTIMNWGATYHGAVAA